MLAPRTPRSVQRGNSGALSLARAPLSVNKRGNVQQSRPPLLQYPKTPSGAENSKPLLLKTPKAPTFGSTVSRIPYGAAKTPGRELSIAYTKTPGAVARLYNKDQPQKGFATPNDSSERLYGKSSLTRGGVMLAGLAGLISGLDSPGHSVALATPKKTEGDLNAYYYDKSMPLFLLSSGKKRRSSAVQFSSTPGNVAGISFAPSTVALKRTSRRLAKTPGSEQKVTRPYFISQLGDPSPLKPSPMKQLRSPRYAPSSHKLQYKHSLTVNVDAEPLLRSPVPQQRTSRSVSFASAAMGENDPFDTTPESGSFTDDPAVLRMDHLTGPLCRVEASTTHTKLSKAKYAQQQQFSKEFHAYSSKQQDFAAVYAWGMHKLESTPEENKWGVYYELAKLCRERDQHEQAGAMFAKLTEMQPDFINGWLDHVKCEEVAGNLNFAVSVLVEGIRHNPCNEHLAIRLLKLVEKMEDGVGAQQVCDFIGRSDPASTWKSWLQMALFKSRRGLVNEAARIMHFLVDKLPRNGVISNEAAKLEASLGHYPEAFEICHRGMEQSSRYGLLWFTYLRLFCINKANASLADKWADVSIASIVQRAQQNLSADLLWKIHFEAAQMKASLGDFAASEVWFKKSGSTCPSSLQWKVLLGNSRMKLRWGAAEVKKYKRRSALTDRHFCDAQVLISESLSCCPQKMKSTVLIECAHLEEFMGNPTRAKQLLGDARCKGKSAWRAALEEILLHLRQQDHASALTHAKQALQEYPFTGRLWGLLIQLLELEGPDAQLACFHEAVQQVPKSGEVWSAGARLALNPTSPHFNLDQAIARLNKSIKFTPQFGDSFIDSTLHALLREGVGHARESAISDISRKCIAADPNYGTQWFRAMSSGPGLCMPGVSAGDVLAQAHVSLVEDLHTFRHVYQAALIGSQASAQDTQAWREGHHNALQRMHPNTQQLAMPDRYELLFGCDSLSA